MGELAPATANLSLVVASDSLADRIALVLREWNLPWARMGESEALEGARKGTGRIVICDWQKGRRLYLQQLRAAGAVPVVLLAQKVDTLTDVEMATAPSELVAAVFRAQGRLEGVETGSLERINRFSQAIAIQFTLPELVKEAIAKTRELCEADGASLLLVDHASGELCFDVVNGDVAGAIEQVRLKRGHGIAGKVAIEGRPRLVSCVADCADFDPSVDRQSGYHTGSIVAAPLILGGDILGVLMAVRRVDEAPFGPLHLERLVALAPHVAIAVHNAQITTALRTTQSEVLQANATLEQKVRERTEQISRAKQEWERTFDAIDEPIALLDGFTIRRSNRAYARRLGLRVQDLPGKTCHRVFAGRETPCPGCPLVKGRGAGLGAELEVTSPGAAHAAIFRFSGYWLSDDAISNAIVIHYQDITQSRSLEGRLRETERLAAVGQLASGAAHEINNPLGFVTSNLRSLRGLLDELRQPLRLIADVSQMAREKRVQELVEVLANLSPIDSQDLDDGLEMIDESLDGARRVGEIVKGLRELSRLEIGKREPADVNASLTRVLRKEFGEKFDSLVQLALEARAPAEIAPLQLDQVMGHVLKNARQSVQGRQKVLVRSWSGDGEVVIQVQDEGAGIARENLRRVFEPFFTTRGIGKGIGLGLTAAYGIVKRVGGEITAESDGVGKGATFTIRLPRAEAKLPATTVTPEPRPAPSAPPPPSPTTDEKPLAEVRAIGSAKSIARVA